MTDPRSVIVVGGGHNGLVCAAYLARAGCRVTVLEAAATVGGAAVTREFAPGFRVSACAHLLYLLHPGIGVELGLERHGLAFAATGLETIALGRDGRHVTLGHDTLAGAGIDAAEQARYVAFLQRMRRFAAVLAWFAERRPPRLPGRGLADTLALLGMGWRVRRMGREDMRELLRVIGINIYDLLAEESYTDAVQGALALDAVLGTRTGPRSPNSVLTFLHRLGGGDAAAPALPRGGMGAVSAAIGAAAAAAGVAVRTGVRVQRIVIEAGRAIGVEIAGGEIVRADLVVSNADPKTTFLDLVGAANVETGFTRRIDHIRGEGMAAKLHLALDRLPAFTGLDAHQLGQRLVLAPSAGDVERAFDQAKYGGYSSSPVMEVTIPTLHDPQLAPDGGQVLSAIVQYAPYHLKDGWDAARDTFRDICIRALAAHAPEIETHIVHAELLTPVDIEREIGINGGHWHHGELSLDQFLMLRPVPGAARYATPIERLYLCGAGTHPGGGVCGLAGRNAARAVLRGEPAA